MLKQFYNVNKEKVFILFLAAVEAVAVIVRCFYGIEVTDEAYYLANANMVMQGKIPIVDIWTFHSGSLMVYGWLIGLYFFLVSDLEGVFLFTRITFTIFRFLILFYGYRVLKRKISCLPALCFCMVLVPYYGFINNFSYNSVGEWGLLLTGFVMWDSCNREKEYLMFGIAGVLMALTVYSHPGMILNILVFGLLCFFMSKEKIKSFAAYVMGGMGTAVFIFAGIVMKSGGEEKLFYSFHRMITTDPQTVRPGKFDTIMQAIQKSRFEITSLMIVIVLLGIVVIISYLLKKEFKRKNLLFFYGIFIWIGLNLLRDFYLTIGNETDKHYGTLAGIASFCIFLVGKKDRINTALFLLYSFPAILFTVTNGLITGGGLYERFGSMIPCFAGLVGMFFHSMEALACRKGAVVRTGMVLSVMCSAAVLAFDYEYAYREEVPVLLDERVQKGIYKGLYTTKNNAEIIQEIEEIVQKKTDKEETILAMDCAPEIYLMTQAKALAPSAWDNMHYADNKNNPAIMYEYFEFMGEIPDVIVYTASPYKKNPSIFMEDYLFNDFVNKYYVQEYHQKFTDDYELLIYKCTNK